MGRLFTLNEWVPGSIGATLIIRHRICNFHDKKLKKSNASSHRSGGRHRGTIMDTIKVLGIALFSCEK